MRNVLKLKNIICFIAVFVIFFVFQFLLQFSEEGAYSCTQISDYAVAPAFKESKDVTVADGRLVFSGSEPVLTYELDNSFYFINAKIKFTKPLEHSEKLILDYAGDNGEFTYWNGDAIYVDKGADEFIAPLSSNWNIKTITIAPEAALYDYPAIESITLQKTGKASKLSLIAAWAKEDARLLIMLIISLAFAVLFTGFCTFAGSMDLVNKSKAARYNLGLNLLAIGIILVSVFTLYQNYFAGNSVFVFTDCAGDSGGLFYPTLLNESKWIGMNYADGFIDFSKGLGARIYISDAKFDLITAFFGADNVGFLTVLFLFIKVTAAAICVYFTAVLYSNNRKAALVVALAYAFCADCTIRAAWPAYSRIMLFVALWLLAFELYHKKGMWYFIPFPTMLMLSYFDTFYQLFWAVLLVGYAAVRCLMDEKINNKLNLKKIFLIEGVFVASILVFQQGLVQNILANIAGDRFQSGLGKYVSYNPLPENEALLRAGLTGIFAPRTNLISGFLRTIGQNIGGITINYTGGNYLLDLTLYCGILSLILVPVAIYNINKSKQRWYGLLVAVALAFIFIYPVTMVMTAFTGLYKLSSQWIIVTMVLLALEALTIIMSGEKLRKGSMIVLAITDAVIFAVSALSLKWGYVHSKKLLMLSLAFVAIYTLLIFAYSRWDTLKKYIGNILLFSFVIELIAVSWPSFNDRMVFTKDYDKYLEDGTVSAVNYLRDYDNSFYRTEKQTTSIADNDSLAQGYFGTRYYIGGGSGGEWFDYYDYLDLPTQGNYRLNGVISDTYAMSLLGVKYYLSADNINDKYGYEFVDRIDGISIYKSKNSLPMAYVTDRIMKASDMDELDAFSRIRNMINGAYVTDDTDIRGIATEQPKTYSLDETKLKKLDVAAVASDEAEQVYDIDISNDELLVVKLTLDDSLSNPEYYYTTKTGQTEVIYFGARSGEKILEICVDDLDKIWFTKKLYKALKDIEFYSADRDAYYADFVADANTAGDNQLKNMTCDNFYNDITGTIDAADDGVLVTSICYDSDLSIIIDGEEAEVIRVNGIFAGAVVDKGTHSIEIHSNWENRVVPVSIVMRDMFVQRWLLSLLVIPIGILINKFINYKKRRA